MVLHQPFMCVKNEMGKRVYKESVKKWATSLGISGSIIFLIFMYLSTSGAITITSFSDDLICEGTEYDPCFVYINFTANEDIFIYPLDYDPWGRNTPFIFDPAIKNFTMARSWGTSWRDYDLYHPCQQKWCGAPENNMKDNKYSLAWREGKDYTVRIEIYKNKATDEIKVILP